MAAWLFCAAKILGPARGEIAAARRRAGLQDHRPALRAARDRQRAAACARGADIVGVADLARVGENARSPGPSPGRRHPSSPTARSRPRAPRRRGRSAGPSAAAHPCRNCAPRGRSPRSRRSSRRGPRLSRSSEPRGCARAGRAGGRSWRAWRRGRDARSPAPSAAARPSGRGSWSARRARRGRRSCPVDVGEAEQVGEEAAVEACGLQHPGDVLVTLGLQDVVELQAGMAPSLDMLPVGPSSGTPKGAFRAWACRPALFPHLIQEAASACDRSRPCIYFAIARRSLCLSAAWYTERRQQHRQITPSASHALNCAGSPALPAWHGRTAREWSLALAAFPCAAPSGPAGGALAGDGPRRSWSVQEIPAMTPSAAPCSRSAAHEPGSEATAAPSAPAIPGTGSGSAAG